MISIKSKLEKFLDNECLVLALIIIIALVFRLYRIDNPIADWHSFRQADTASVTRQYLRNGLNLLVPRYHDISTTQSGLFNPKGYRFVEFPIFNLIHFGLFKYIGVYSLEVWGRMVSVIASLFSLYIIYLLGKRYLGILGGYIAAFYFAVLPFNVYFSRVILPEPLAVTFALAGVWLFLTYTDKNELIRLILSAFFFSLALLIKPFTLFFTFPLLILVVKEKGIKNALTDKRLILFSLLMFAPFVLWRFWIRQFPEGIPFWKWMFNGDAIRFKPAFWKWIFGERLSKLILGYWGLVPFSFALINYRKSKRFIYTFLLGMIFYVSIFATVNVRHDYYQTIVVPSVVLALSWGTITMLKQKQFKKRNSYTLLILSLFLGLLISAQEVSQFYKINRPEIIKAGLATQRVVPENSLVIAPYNGDTAFLYQTNRVGWPVVDRPIDGLIDWGAQYFVSVDLNHYQTVEFSERFQVLEKTDHYTILKLEENR